MIFAINISLWMPHRRPWMRGNNPSSSRHAHQNKLELRLEYFGCLLTLNTYLILNKFISWLLFRKTHPFWNEWHWFINYVFIFNFLHSICRFAQKWKKEEPTTKNVEMVVDLFFYKTQIHLSGMEFIIPLCIFMFLINILLFCRDFIHS